MKIFILLLTLCFSVNAAIIPTTINGINGTSEGLWTFTDSNGLYDDSGFEMEFSYGSFNTRDHEFGFYQYDAVNKSILSTLAIFDATNTVGDSSNVKWDFVDDTASTRHGSIDLIGNSYLFGFYFQSDGRMFYSQAELNANGQDNFGFYWDEDPYSTTNLIVYAGDNGTGGSYDYIQVAIDDVKKVPEPNVMFLFGMVLFGIAVLKKSTAVDV